MNETFNEGFEEIKQNSDIFALSQEYAKLKSEISERKTAVADLERRRAEIEPILYEDMSAGGFNSINVNGYTIYRKLTERARINGNCKDQVQDACHAIGMDHLLTINAQSLSAFVKEAKANELWETDQFKPLRNIVDIYEQQQVLARKS